MERFSVERLVYDGSDPSDDWVVTGIGHSRLNLKNIKTVSIDSMHEFEAGCKIHDNCLGHMGRSSSGLLLPIQSLSIHNVHMSNSIYKAVSYALKGDTDYYKKRYYETLDESMKGKRGNMRKGIVNCHIDGSMRMVITPHYYDKNVVTIPYYLQGKWMVCRLDKETNKYRSMPVQDGDHAIAIRPPALSGRSVQPVIIRFWRETCIGINPELLKSFEGDYDGDEMHFNPVYSDGAMEECRRWINTPNPTMERAAMLLSQLDIPGKTMRPGGHMIHTTMSFTQIMNGDPQPLMAEETRVKMEHINAFRQRMLDPQSWRISFDKESIRGMGDINRQQLSQPIVGDMSRIARICASCVAQQQDGTIGIHTSSGFVPIMRSVPDASAGNTAMRAISTICASAQQVALDSHRVKSDALPSHDMIRDMIVGSENTVIVLSRISPRLHHRDGVKWVYANDKYNYVICNPDVRYLIDRDAIVAAYNPSILACVQQERRFNVCYNGIRMLLNYYSIALTSAEITSLAVLYTYMPQAHHLPITSKDGMYARKLQWLETTMARHYMGLRKTVNKTDIGIAPIRTVSMCLMGANFIESLNQ